MMSTETLFTILLVLAGFLASISTLIVAILNSRSKKAKTKKEQKENDKEG